MTLVCALQKEAAGNADLREKQAAYDAAKEARGAAFSAAFAHVQEAVSKIYSDLTKSQAHKTGGRATLFSTNDAEPYLGGIQYAIVPPGKRYRVMGDCSGGERTLAALALLLAVHSYKPSPFFVFDEVRLLYTCKCCKRFVHGHVSADANALDAFSSRNPLAVTDNNRRGYCLLVCIEHSYGDACLE